MSGYNLVRLPEIERVLFPQRAEERAELERRVLAEGIRDPLVVWRRGAQMILVDGHNRHELAKRHGLDYKVLEREFESVEDCVEWIYRNQIARRNLTDEQRAMIMGRMYMIRNEAAKRADGGRDLGPSGPNRTAKAVAQEVGVSEKTVRNAAAFVQTMDKLSEVNPEAAERVLRGDVSDALTRLSKVKDDSEFERIAERIASGAKRVAGPNPKQGSFRMTEPREIVITCVLERLGKLDGVHALRLADGSILSVRDGQAVMLSICGVAPNEKDVWEAAGVPIRNVETAEEAEHHVTGQVSDSGAPEADEGEEEAEEGAPWDEGEPDPSEAALAGAGA
jgi:hypothetical protein